MRLIPDEAIAAVTIFQEAEGESYACKVAVAEVIRNRMERFYSSDGTVAGTVLKRFQFSGWESSAANRIRSLRIDDTNPTAMDCVRAWAAARSGSENVPGAVLFYATTLAQPPSWAVNANFVA